MAINAASPLLQVNHLKKYFKTPRGMLHAVDDVTFSLEQGKTLGVVGESGCGKSTMGRTILRLLEPTDGEVLFEGADVSRLNAAEMRSMRTKMQMIFQDPFSSLDPGNRSARPSWSQSACTGSLPAKRNSRSGSGS